MRFPRFFGLLLTPACALSPLQNACAQGSLTPPGPPGPTMKTLAQIEPRTLISALPFTITASGSYYLTTNLTGVAATSGITIQADDVTLDLNGFALTGASGSLHGVGISGARKNILVRNGTLNNWRTGVEARATVYSRFAALQLYNNTGDGITVGAVCVIMDCVSHSNGSSGINADRETTIQNCIVRGNSLDGIQAGFGSQVVSCAVAFNSDTGIVTQNNCLISNCTALNNASSGIATTQGSQIVGSSASNNGGSGILAGIRSVLLNCSALSNSAFGIVAAENCRITGSFASANSRSGITAGNDSDLEGCSASHNLEHGMTAGTNCEITQSNALNNAQAGIRVDSGSTVRDCTAHRNHSAGILVASECTVVANHCNNNFNARDAAGIRATGTDNCIQANNVISNDRGISVDAAGSVILKNTAANNTINFFFVGDQTMGPIFKGRTTIDSLNPWTNFEF